MNRFAFIWCFVFIFQVQSLEAQYKPPKFLNTFEVSYSNRSVLPFVDVDNYDFTTICPTCADPVITEPGNEYEINLSILRYLTRRNTLYFGLGYSVWNYRNTLFFNTGQAAFSERDRQKKYISLNLGYRYRIKKFNRNSIFIDGLLIKENSLDGDSELDRILFQPAIGFNLKLGSNVVMTPSLIYRVSVDSDFGNTQQQIGIRFAISRGFVYVI